MSAPRKRELILTAARRGIDMKKGESESEEGSEDSSSSSSSSECRPFSCRCCICCCCCCCCFCCRCAGCRGADQEIFAFRGTYFCDARFKTVPFLPGERIALLLLATAGALVSLLLLEPLSCAGDGSSSLGCKCAERC